MTTQTFTWSATDAATGDATFRVRTAQFGDGYAQVVADGLHNRVGSWPLTFTGPTSRIEAIMAFLDARGGSESFYWTPPLGVQGLYRCAQYSLHREGGDIYSVTATFDEAFAP